jgi:DNA-directed RNA polymerase subunit RPC12/RpoP
MSEERLRFPYYRCYRCGKGMTKFQIIKKWEKEEATKSGKLNLCACGSRQIVPANPSLLEELFKPSIWLLWLKEFSPFAKKK